MNGLKPGEKYLTIEIDLGILGVHKVNAFLNKNRTRKEQPVFKGRKNGIKVAVWVNKKKEVKQ